MQNHQVVRLGKKDALSQDLGRCPPASQKGEAVGFGLKMAFSLCFTPPGPSDLGSGVPRDSRYVQALHCPVVTRICLGSRRADLERCPLRLEEVTLATQQEPQAERPGMVARGHVGGVGAPASPKHLQSCMRAGPDCIPMLRAFVAVSGHAGSCQRDRMPRAATFLSARLNAGPYSGPEKSWEVF